MKYKSQSFSTGDLEDCWRKIPITLIENCDPSSMSEIACSQQLRHGHNGLRAIPLLEVQNREGES